MQNKLVAIRKILAQSKADAVILMADQSRLWMTGFASTYGWLFVKRTGKPVFFLDGRYFAKGKDLVKGCDVILLQGKALTEYVAKQKIKTALVESEYTTLAVAERMKAMGVKAIGFDSLALREVKGVEEVAKLQKACDISHKAFNELVKTIKPGDTEKAIASRLSALHVKFGAEKDSFDSIVASGENGAYPHHKTSDRKVKNGEFVTIDFGCVYQGYCSDITRTILVGNKPIGKAVKVSEYYDIVKAAQAKGVAAVKPGVTGKQIDAVCRDYLKEKGYDLPHGTGHGLGIDVHEEPRASSTNERPLVEGNVITVEPGIYVPGVGGVRIEDDVLVVSNGYRNLSGKLAKR